MCWSEWNPLMKSFTYSLPQSGAHSKSILWNEIKKKKPLVVDVIILNVLRDLPFSPNEQLKLDKDKGIGIFKNKVKSYEASDEHKIKKIILRCLY